MSGTTVPGTTVLGTTVLGAGKDVLLDVTTADDVGPAGRADDDAVGGTGAATPERSGCSTGVAADERPHDRPP